MSPAVECQVPIRVRLVGEPTDEDLARLEDAVARAVGRQLAAAGRTLARAGGPATGETREDYDAVRHHGAWYEVPSHQQPSAPTRVPVRSRTGDRVHHRPFPPLTLVKITTEYLRSGGTDHVTSASLARAKQWGHLLYGAQGFAVLERRDERPRDRFVAVPFADPLRSSKFDLGAATPIDDPDVPGDVRAAQRGELWPTARYRIVLAVTADDVMLFHGRPDARWQPGTIFRELARTPSTASVSAEVAAAEATALLDDGRLLARIVGMDRSVFQYLPWRQRAAYLNVLVCLAWPGEREQRAMVELVAAARSRTEVEAMLALLREAGTYERLFAKLDGTVVHLLLALGEWSPAEPVSAGYLIDLFDELGLLGTTVDFLDDPIEYTRNVFDGALSWARATIGALADLFDHSLAEIADAVQHIADFVLLIDRATRFPPDPEALAQLRQLAELAGATIHKAIRGLRYAEEAGAAYENRGGGPRIGAQVLQRLRIALALEVLTWFVGIGEVKAGLAVARAATTRAAELLRLFSGARRLSRVGAAAEQLARLDRLLVVLTRLGAIEAESTARVLRLLPEADQAALVRLADKLDVPLDASAEVLRGIAVDRGIAGDTAEFLNVLTVARRLEQRARPGEVTAELAAALDRLMATGWGPVPLGEIVDAIPGIAFADWALALSRLRPEQVARLGADGLTVLGASPRSLRFVMEAGGDAYLAVWTRAGGDIDAVEDVLGGLLLRRTGSPADYQRQLDRIAAGEEAAFRAAAVPLAHPAADRLAAGGHRHLEEMFEELEDDVADLRGAGSHGEAAAQARERDLLATRLSTLPDEELTGFERLAQIGDETGTDLVSEILNLPPGGRRALVLLIRDLTDRLPVRRLENIEQVLGDIMLRDVTKSGQTERPFQGSMGQLYAARTLIDDLGATRLRFELEMPGSRRMDISAYVPGRPPVHVEVKTNLEGNRASFDRKEIVKDLVSYAARDYADLIYLYHVDVADELASVGQTMLNLVASKDVRDRLRLAGVDPDDARKALERWLAAGNLRTYRTGGPP